MKNKKTTAPPAAQCILIRFATPEEKRKIEKLAQKAGMSFSNYVRSRLDLEPIGRGGWRGGGRPRKEKPPGEDDAPAEKTKAARA